MDCLNVRCNPTASIFFTMDSPGPLFVRWMALWSLYRLLRANDVLCLGLVTLNALLTASAFWVEVSRRVDQRVLLQVRTCNSVL